MKVLKELIGSKKALMAVATLLAVVLSAVGLNVPESALTTIVTAIAGVGSAFIIGQGAADHGKEKAKIEAETAKELSNPSQPSTK